MSAGGRPAAASDLGGSRPQELGPGAFRAPRSHTPISTEKGDKRSGDGHAAFGAPTLLTIAEVADALSVSTKTVRRMIDRGELVPYRIGRQVRVDASSVTRLLAASLDGAANEISMVVKEEESSPGEPRLLRQRGRSKVWTAWINNQEVPLGTTNKTEAHRKLNQMTAASVTAPPSSKHTPEGRLPWRVYEEGGSFVIKYYDAEGHRRTHRLDEEAGVLVRTRAEAELFAEAWFHQTTGRAGRPLGSVQLVVSGDAERITFEQFGRLWTSGELAKRYPDHVRTKRSAVFDERRLKLYVYPIIGHHPMSAFEGRAGLVLVEQVLDGLPPVGSTFSRASRRQIIQAVHRMLVLAVYPAKLLTVNPLPKGFLPKSESSKAKTYLYPDEDAKLLACRQVPLVRRLFYGILAREGVRVSELLSLTWSDLDLDRGAVNLDENKTDEPRTWALDPGVAEALRRWKKHFTLSGARTKPVFVDRSRKRVCRFAAASGLRRFLKKAGVDRAQLFDDSDTRINLRAHDLRATFVTVNLAAGRTEAWITDRTGHKSSAMIYRYKRQARTHAELTLGTLKPLHEAIPELAQVSAT